MLLIIIITLFILGISYLLFTPICLVIDTHKHLYYIQQKGLLKAQLMPDDNAIFKIRIRLLFFHFNIWPLKHKKRAATKKKTPKLKRKHSKRPIKLKRLMAVLRSFKVKTFHLNFDSGNCISNAKFYPAFALLNYFNMDCHINFLGRNALLLVIENRPIRIIKSFINN